MEIQQELADLYMDKARFLRFSKGLIVREMGSYYEFYIDQPRWGEPLSR